MTDDDHDSDPAAEDAADSSEGASDEESFVFVDETISEGGETVSDGEETVSDGEETVSDGEETVSDGETTDGPDGTAPGDDRTPDRETDPAGGGPTDGVSDAPLSDLARDVARRREERDGAAGGDREADPFEEIDVGDVDTGTVWEDLVEDGDDERPPGAVAGEEVSKVDADLPEYVVPKRAYCQRCRHFAAPPEVACTHEGTDIVELVDADHFRVRACPMVGEDAREFE